MRRILLSVLFIYGCAAKFQVTVGNLGIVGNNSFKIWGGYHIERTQGARLTLPQSYVVSDTPVQVDAGKTKMKIKYPNGRLLNAKTRDRVFELENVISQNLLKFRWCETDSDGYFTCSVKEWTLQQFVDMLNRKDTQIQFLPVDAQSVDFAFDAQENSRWQHLYKTRYECAVAYVHLMKELQSMIDSVPCAD